MKYENIVAFELLNSDTFELQDQLNLSLWVQQVGANLESPEGLRLAKTGNFPMNRQIGAWYYYLINKGLVKHSYGINNVKHYLEMPLSWLTETYTVEEVDGYTDEFGIDVPASTIITTNEEFYTIAHRNENHCLVKITDKLFNELYELINFEESTLFGVTDIFASNVICSDKYLEAIQVGGSYYVEPIMEDI